MDTPITIKQVELKQYKAFSNFRLNLQSMNVLVGPNNTGKSTILNAFRLLSVGMRRANSRAAVVVPGPTGDTYGHFIPTEDIPISFENVHHNYDTSQPCTITFVLSNDNKLVIYFTPARECYLIPVPVHHSARTPATFRKEFPIKVDFIPVLGPLEHNEQSVEEQTVVRNLATHRASRNFRNYWRYNKDAFNEFATLLATTWPGMDIRPPELLNLGTVFMFYIENGDERELYWSGFGFQAWCQLLTNIVRAKATDILVVDEPEVYLHPDLQRQLISLLRNAGPRIILATHSTEVITEADADEVLIIDKTHRTARRLRNVDQIQDVVEALGSKQNITLAQLARTRKVLFVEGDDFKILGQFARVLDLPRVANQSDFAVVSTEGFSHWQKLLALQWGIEKILGDKLQLGAVFDRDYRSDEEITEIERDLSKDLEIVHFHERKELENYLLLPAVLEKAILRRYNDSLNGKPPLSIEEILDELSTPMKADIQAKYIAERNRYFNAAKKDASTITAETIRMFEAKWSNISSRMEIVPGKTIFSSLNGWLQDNYHFSLTAASVVREYKKANVPQDLTRFLKMLEQKFGQRAKATS